ncbi:FIST signal transduction protein [Hugenholtzia roseola]|uniref:FIST signal transduction protein n=1 Tax=Hugenholtzia roseola TaxID=1002 RepID=UPI0004036EA3|nr:FIST N-terminal domain-containing protein [Hugenholtzia roseola]
MQTQTFSAQNLAELTEKIDRFLAQSPDFKPTLAFLFCSVEQDLKGISHCFAERDIALFGATTAGEILNDSVLENAIAVMLLNLNPDAFRLLMAQNQEGVRQNAQNLAQVAQETFAQPALLVASAGLATNGDDIVEGVKNIIPNPKLFGALAGDDFKMSGTFVFNQTAQTDNGLLFLALDTERVSVEGLATSGWKPVGTERTITKAAGNVIYTIDDEPALDVFIKYFKYEDIDENEKADVIVKLGTNHPFHLQRPDGSSVLRAPLMSQEKALIFAGAIPQGAKVRFSMPPDFTVIDQAIEDVATLQTNLPEAEAILLFSCKARHLALGMMVEDEIAGFQNLWQAPLVGLFSYGELGCKVGFQNCDFHNETSSVVILKEKSN